MRYGFAFILFVHGLIHLIGFINAFNSGVVLPAGITTSVSSGLLWLFTSLLFMSVCITLLMNKRIWRGLLAAALIFSQILIISYWQEARFGSLINLFLAFPLALSIIDSLPWSYRNIFKAKTAELLAKKGIADLITETDLHHLPSPVQRYLRFAGVVGKPRIYNFYAVFSGKMKTRKQGSWIDIVSDQYNFYGSNSRYFYISSALFGLPFEGLHIYEGNAASMRIKIASLLRVADAKGPEMNQSETVTMFNDMCLLAPATLIDREIKWTMIDDSAVDAAFTNGSQTITARLIFNQDGSLSDFQSNDRFLSANGKTYQNFKWSTPIFEFVEFDGMKAVQTAEAIWHMPEEKYIYARFKLQKLEYNCAHSK